MKPDQVDFLAALFGIESPEGRKAVETVLGVIEMSQKPKEPIAPDAAGPDMGERREGEASHARSYVWRPWCGEYIGTCLTEPEGYNRLSLRSQKEVLADNPELSERRAALKIWVMVRKGG